MKTKQGYKKQKTQTSTGKWLKRYFLKRTSRKDKHEKSLDKKEMRW